MSDKEFILVEGSAGRVSEFLIQEVDEFSSSEEYLRLDDEDRRSSGIVCGAFSNYISRIYGEGSASSLLNNAFDAIESLSSMKDIEIKNIVVTELFENIHFDEYPELILKLRNNSKALYDRWLA